VKQGAPFPEGSIRGQHDRSGFITGSDHLEQQIGPALVDGQIAQLIEEEKGGTDINFECFAQRSVDLGRGEMIDHIYHTHKAKRVAPLARRVTQCSKKIDFPVPVGPISTAQPCRSMKSQSNSCRITALEIRLGKLKSYSTKVFCLGSRAASSRRWRARCWRAVCSRPISMASTSNMELPLRAASASTSR